MINVLTLILIFDILFLSVFGMGYVILLWHSLSLPYNYFVNFPFLDGNVPRRLSYGVYISQECSHFYLTLMLVINV